MELGSPHGLNTRTRTRGSRRSDDVPGTPGTSGAPSTPLPHLNDLHTPASTRRGRATTGRHFTPGGPNSNHLNTPRSNLISHHHIGSFTTPRRGNETPNRTPEQSGALSQLVSPSTQSNIYPTGPNSFANYTPKSVKPKQTSESPEKAPVVGRIVKVFKGLPFSHNFELEQRIGEGTFSTVYLASRRDKDVKIALKHLVPTSKPSRIVMETSCMRSAAGHQNVIRLLGMWRVGGDIVLAMPYIKHSKFSDLIFMMDLSEIQDYIGNLLAALEHIHHLGIIHRDIKPSNFLYDRQQRRYALVDFGLAQNQSDLTSTDPPVENKGSKRKLSDICLDSAKRHRGANYQEKRLSYVTDKVDPVGVLESADNKLNRSPKARILRDFKLVRRSPRKTASPHKTEQQPPSQVQTDSPNLTPRKRLRLQMTPKNGSKSPSETTTPSVVRSLQPIRQSPRKHSSLSRPGTGFSKLTITANSILGGGSGSVGSVINAPHHPHHHPYYTSTPSPSSLTRTPSFTMLEPTSCYNTNGTLQHSQLSQSTTDSTMQQARTPLLCASITSACCSSSATPAALTMLPTKLCQLQKQQQHHEHRHKQLSHKHHHHPSPSVGGSGSSSPAYANHCYCVGRAVVCSVCLSLAHMHAPRAGTPGFRPPEVLLKHANQTTAIDLWAVGVILLSVLSRSYPFFRAPDDMTALAELTVLFGSGPVRELAKKLGRKLVTSLESEAMDLAVVCRELSVRERKDDEQASPNKTATEDEDGDEEGRRQQQQSTTKPSRPHYVTDGGVSLLTGLLTLDHTKRLTAAGALKHSYFKGAKIN